MPDRCKYNAHAPTSGQLVYILTLFMGNPSKHSFQLKTKIMMDFSVNYPTPKSLAAQMSETGKIEEKRKQIIGLKAKASTDRSHNEFL